jgi:hypothetical protein
MGYVRQCSFTRKQLHFRSGSRHCWRWRTTPSLFHHSPRADEYEQVVLSFVFASIMTTTASILAMLLDQAFDAKGQFTVRAPFKYIREHVFDTGWKKDFAWRPFLDPLIIGMGDQQLITGYAVLLSGWIKVRKNPLESMISEYKLTSWELDRNELV